MTLEIHLNTKIHTYINNLLMDGSTTLDTTHPLIRCVNCPASDSKIKTSRNILIIRELLFNSNLVSGIFTASNIAMELIYWTDN